MLKQPLQSETRLEEALACICRKTGMSPHEIIKAFEGLVMMGYADRRKVETIKAKLKNFDPERFH